MKIYVTSSDIRTFPQKILYSSISSKKLNVEKFLTRCTEVEECVFWKKTQKKQYLAGLLNERHHILYPYPLKFRNEQTYQSVDTACKD